METTQICTSQLREVGKRARKYMDASGGGALCVYLDGSPVVDIWSGSSQPAEGRDWQRDTMAMSWSTTKGVASTVIHMLAQRGALAYDEPVSTYWPEFAAQGKRAMTVRHVLSMEAGLYDIRHLIDDPQQMLDHTAMATALAAAKPAHPPGTANAYHAFTYGWLVGEIVRRVTGESLGAFVERNIAQPLGLDGFYIGTPDSELARVATRPNLKPEPTVARALAKMVDPVTSLFGLSPRRIAAAFLPKRGHEVITTDAFLSAEVPSVNGTFTARSLARFYAALGSEDGLDGTQLWTPETRREATKPQNERRDRIVPLRVRWRMGYHPPFPAKRASANAFGFYGAYGSGAYADPSRRLAVGFVVQEAKGTPLTKLAPAINAALDGS